MAHHELDRLATDGVDLIIESLRFLGPHSGCSPHPGSRLLLSVGAVGLMTCAVLTAFVAIAWMRGAIPVLGYTRLALGLAAIGAFASLGFGVVGQ